MTDAHTGRARAFHFPQPVWTAVLTAGVQAGLAILYLVFTDAGLTAPRMLIIPFLWVTAAVVAVVHTTPTTVPGRTRLIALGTGVVYGLGLALIGGQVTPLQMGATEVAVVLLPPWWGPAIAYETPLVAGVIFPYRLVGYAALAYLAYTAGTRVAATGSTLGSGVGGAVGLISCTGCAVPVVVSGVGLTIGMGIPPIGPITPAIGTVSYLLAISLLARPTA